MLEAVNHVHPGNGKQSLITSKGSGTNLSDIEKETLYELLFSYVDVFSPKELGRTRKKNTRFTWGGAHPICHPVWCNLPHRGIKSVFSSKTC